MNVLTDEERAARHREQQRRYREADPQKKLEQQRRWRASNAEKIREKTRQYRAANLEKVREKERRYRRSNNGRLWLRQRHGMRQEDWAALWDAQGGQCYLCGDPLTQETAVIDHDHGCCPDHRSCGFCRRGLCCGSCNRAIGYARDDPDRLERMAASLRVAQLAVARRMVAKPVQETLLGGDPT